ncbi:MAG: fibronectin type III domain-containing protein [Paludibacteraceae bacterium]|nr:fibronectin type III domain-containing protein [Paludibacteraceae bacterium]
MKKSIFAVMAFVAVVTLVSLVGIGCSKNLQKSEVAVIVSDITDSTAYVTCDYHPEKSVSYQLFVCKAVSGECNKSTRFKIAGLRCGSRYEVVVISYNSKHKQVGSTVLNFVTTGVPENKEEVRGIYPPSEDSTVVIFNDEVPDDGK